jgi:hypothetical protein
MSTKKAKAAIIRTPSKVLGGITAEEKARLDAHAAKWIANAMSTEPVAPGRLVPAIKALYAAAGLKEPRVVIVPSPLVMVFAGGFAAAIWWARKNNSKALRDRLAFNSATYSATLSATRSATDSPTRSATRSATLSPTDSATLSATLSATYSATLSATDSIPERFASLARDIGSEFGVDHIFMLRCAQNWYSMYQGGNMWSAYDCYLTAFRDVLGLVLPEHEKYKAWEACAIEGGFRVMHEDFCIVSDRPEILRVDAENRPHCEDGPSHRWRDGWSLYHWHGVRIPDEWMQGKKPTAQEALMWPNIEQRRAACEIVGWSKIMEQLDARVIDAHENDEIGTLLEAEIPDSGRERFLRVRCGTGRAFCLPVPPHCTTAMEANAWSYGLDPNEFAPEVRT